MTAYYAAINGEHTTEERQQALERIAFRIAQLREEISGLEGMSAGHQAALSHPATLATGASITVTGPDNGGDTEHLLGRKGTLVRRAADLSAAVEFGDGFAPFCGYFPDSSLEVTA